MKEMKRRDVSIELLRIILMSMIVVWHFVVYGMGINECRDVGFNWGSNIYASLLCPFLCFHVNCFNFISGFYGIKFRVKKIVVLNLLLIFLTFVTYLIAVFGGGRIFDARELIHDLICSYQNWWYMTCYFILLLIAPLINKGIDWMEKNLLRNLVVTYYIVLILPSMIWNQATNMALFIFIYCCGRYLNKYNNKFIKENAGRIFLFSILVLFIMRYTGWYFQNSYLYLQSISYNNPIVIFAGISFFYIFQAQIVNLKTSLVSQLIPGILAVYLVSDSAYLRMQFNSFMVDIASGNLLILCIMALLCTIIISYMGGLLNNFLSFGYDKFIQLKK